MKVGMISLMGNIPQRLSSHNAGWSFCLREILIAKGYDSVDFLKQTDNIESYDVIVINNGINFKEGGWNFIGGPPKTLKDLLVQFCNYKGRIASFNEKIDFKNLVRSRREFAGYIWPKYWPEVELWNTAISGPNLVLGDSHSLSVYQPGYGISRNDGKTLHGALRDNGAFIKDKLNEFSYEKVHLYFGNIDIRFHLMRQLNPADAVRKLVDDYLNVIHSINADVTVQALIPIENEDRKIPGSGLYKKQAYFGTREERQALVNLFNHLMIEAEKAGGFTLEYWKFLSPLNFDLMEARQSVHIRPSEYFYDSFRESFVPRTEQNSLF